MNRNFQGNKVSNIKDRKRESPTHESILGGLSKRDVNVTFTTNRGATYVGKITQFDRFTISIICKDDKRVTLFKGALESFSVEK